MVPEANVWIGDTPAYEICMGYVRNMYMIRVEYLWPGRRRCMEGAGNMCGVCIEYVYTVNGMCMGPEVPRPRMYDFAAHFSEQMLLCSLKASPEEMKAMKQRRSIDHRMAELSDKFSHRYVRQSCGNGGVSDSHKPADTIKCLS